jgi:very-short-patch-repair endonuclease
VITSKPAKGRCLGLSCFTLPAPLLASAFRFASFVDRNVADFRHPQRRLIVELDGSVHAQASQTRREASREAELKRMGHPETRLPNGIVGEAPELFVGEVPDAAWSLPNAFTGEL